MLCWQHCFLILIFFNFYISQTLFSGNFFRSISDTSASEDIKDPFLAMATSTEIKSFGSLLEQENAVRELDQVLSFTNSFETTYENIVLKTKDGLKRDAVLTIRKNAKGNMVLCHPAAYDKDFMIPFQEHIFAHYNCIRFDFRRHGKGRKKQRSSLGKKEVYEVLSAIDVIKNDSRTKNLPTYGFGISLGAVVLIQTEAANHKFDGLILQAPFESLKNQIQRTFPVFKKPIMRSIIFKEPVRIYGKLKYNLDLYNVNPVESIKKIKIPIFLIHAKDDPIVPFSAFEKLKITGQHCIKKTWTPVVGFHTDLFKTLPDVYTMRCNDFLHDIHRTI
jgi:uncharacterized protein